MGKERALDMRLSIITHYNLSKNNSLNRPKRIYNEALNHQTSMTSHTEKNARKKTKKQQQQNTL